jgi:hypothetical protein
MKVLIPAASFWRMLPLRVSNSARCGGEGDGQNAARLRSARCSRGRDHVHDRGAAATNLVTEGSDQRGNGPGFLYSRRQLLANAAIANHVRG